MAITPDPATTEWVPVWDTKGTSPSGGGPHAVTHNTGGSDAITNLSATVITSGTLPDIRLSSNVVLNNKNNFYSRRQYFKGGAGDSPTPYYGIEIQGADSIAGDHSALIFNSLNQPVDQRKFRIYNYLGQLIIGSINDAENVIGAEAITIARNGNVTITGKTSSMGAIVVGTTPDNFTPGNNASLYLYDGTMAANSRVWRIMNQNQYLIFYTQNDIESGHVNRMNLDRAGNLVVTGNITSSGSVNITGGLVVTGNFQTQGYIFPGRFDTVGIQGSWYLASHGSYGLYANTGFYLEGGIWTYYVESRAHLRAATGLYDYGRGTPIGVWINVPYDPARFFSTNGTWTVPSANYTLFKYMVVGKTMTISFALGFTTYSGSGNELRMYIPDGFVPTITAAYSGPINYLLSGGNEVGSCIAMSNYITLFRGNAASWPTSPYIHVKGSISFEVN